MKQMESQSKVTLALIYQSCVRQNSGVYVVYEKRGLSWHLSKWMWAHGALEPYGSPRGCVNFTPTTTAPKHLRKRVLITFTEVPWSK